MWCYYIGKEITYALMPTVGSKKFAYTPKGVKAAKKAATMSGKPMEVDEKKMAARKRMTAMRFRGKK